MRIVLYKGESLLITFAKAEGNVVVRYKIDGSIYLDSPRMIRDRDMSGEPEFRDDGPATGTGGAQRP